MDDGQDFPEESLQQIEALLNRHPTQMIQRMFQQVLESRRNSVASSYTSSNSSLRSRLSISSTFSTSTAFSASTGASDYAPSIASSTSSRSRVRRHEPRSYPSNLDASAHTSALLTPSSETSSPLDVKVEQSLTPTDEDGKSIHSPLNFLGDKSQHPLGDSFMFCTYCAESSVLKTFKAKSDWKKHEMRMHETGEDWPCPVIGCGRVNDRQKDFIKHHSRYHSGRPLPSVTDIGIKLLSRKVFGCGFDKCKEVSIGWDERCDHVAKHMKNGSTYEQWHYSNVIRNLIRQEALHDTWKELFASLDERLRESRSQITWSPDNTRVLRQKLQCCDLRPSREDVLITALSLRSDVPLDPSQIQIPPGFVTPSRDSVPNVDTISREQRMQVLNGNSNITLSRTRLAALNMALLQRYYGNAAFGAYTEAPVVEKAEKRISYMDLDTSEIFTPPQEAVPPPPLSIQTQQPLMAEQHPNTGFEDAAKPPNPLGWCYPHFFDAPPTFEDSDYYDRPSLGQVVPRTLQEMDERLGSRNDSPQSRPSSQNAMHGYGPDYPMQFSVHQQPPQQPVQQQQQQSQQQQLSHYAQHTPQPQPHAHQHLSQQPSSSHQFQPQPSSQYVPMGQPFRNATTQAPLHHFSPHV